METANPTETSQKRAPLNILVVDDEEVLRELISSVLALEGHIVQTAANGKEALDKFMRARFDIVFSDRMMPEMTGDELASHVENMSPETPFVMVTAYANKMVDKKNNPAGVDVVVSKPFTAAQLRETLNEYLG